jgi:hypothetical protein
MCHMKNLNHTCQNIVKKVRRRKTPYKMPRHFSKMMNSPYFSSPHYEETKEFEIEKKIENYIDVAHSFLSCVQ